MTKDMTELKAAVEGAMSLTPIPGSTTIPAVMVMSPDLLGRLADAAITAYQSHLSSSGYVIVPREPTEAMTDAAYDQLDWGPTGYYDAPRGAASADLCWEIMLSALPNKEG